MTTPCRITIDLTFPLRDTPEEEEELNVGGLDGIENALFGVVAGFGGTVVRIHGEWPEPSPPETMYDAITDLGGGLSVRNEASGNIVLHKQYLDHDEPPFIYTITDVERFRQALSTALVLRDVHYELRTQGAP